MPDLADRANFESSIVAELAPVFGAEYERAIASPGAAIVPYAQFQADLQRTMADELFEVFSAAGSALAIGSALFFTAGAFEQTGRQWSQQMATALARDVVDTSQRMTSEAFQLARGDKNKLADSLGLVYQSGARLQAIAVTETTRAISAGERAVVIPFNNSIRREGRDDDQRLLIPIWRIDPRSNVCPICLEVNGHSREVWEHVYPGGPPGHPHCACYLDWVSVEEWIEMGGQAAQGDVWRQAA